MRSRWIVAGLLAWLLLAPEIGWAHAYLVRSVPARRAVLSQVPARIQVWFNERLEPAFSSVSVWNKEGPQVDLGDVEVGPNDPKKLSVAVPALSPGPYTVKFRVLSVDGHIVEDQFAFTIRGSR